MGNVKRVEYNQFKTIPDDNQYKSWLENSITIVKHNEFNGTETKYIMYDKTKLVIGYVDKEDRLHFTKEYLDKLREKTGDYYEQLGIENRQIYLNELPELVEFITSSERKLRPEELERLENGEYNQKADDKKKENEKKKQEPEKTPKQVDEENRQIEVDLGLDEGEIVFSAKIKDKQFYDRVPALRATNKPAKLVYTKSGQALLVSPLQGEKGKYEKIAGISEPKSTNRRALNVGREGDLFQEEVIMGEFEIKGYEREYSLGWVIGTGGYPELRELRYEKTNDSMANSVLLAAPVETETEKPVTKDVREIIDHNINKDTSAEMDKYEKLKEEGNDDNIDVDDIADDTEDNQEREKREEEEKEKKRKQEEQEKEDDFERIRSLFEDPRRH